MCYDIQQMGEKIRKQAERQLGVTDAIEGQMAFKFFHVSGFAHPHIMAVTDRHPDRFTALQWGLIPFWVKDHKAAVELARQTLNARSDSVFTKPSYRKAIMERRCVIPVNGFYESRDIKGTKFPYFVHLPDEKIAWLAGIWERWVDPETGELLETCSIITTAANPFMERIHNVKKRMPLILDEASIDRWLDRSADMEELQSVMTPYCGVLEAHTVSRLVNRKRDQTNIPEVSMPFRYPELEVFDQR